MSSAEFRSYGAQWIAGGILVGAAILKAADVIPSHQYTAGFSATWLFIALSQYELFLGMWLLSGLAKTGGWLVAVSTFAVFAGVGLWHLQLGQVNCDCFGSLPVRTWQAVALDVTVLLILGFAWPKSWRFTLKPTALFLGNYLAVLAIWTVAAIAIFGSTDVAVAKLRGDSLVAVPAAVEYGSIPAGETGSATVVFYNFTDREIRLLGGTADCSCTAIDDMPTSVPPGGEKSVVIRFQVPLEPGITTRNAQIWTDLKTVRTVRLTLTARSVTP